jgi:hypothetical protein
MIDCSSVLVLNLPARVWHSGCELGNPPAVPRVHAAVPGLPAAERGRPVIDNNLVAAACRAGDGRMAARISHSLSRTARPPAAMTARAAVAPMCAFSG